MRGLPGLGCLILLTASAAAEERKTFLLVDSEEIEAARRKAERHDWARKTLDALIVRAEKELAAPVNLPDRGGQWPHWYSCKRDGARLKTVSPVEHACPVCGEIYKGDPYDAVVLYGVHMRYSHATRDLGLAYRFTGREAFARRAAEILLGYADRYGKYPLHDRFGEPKTGGGRIMAQTLDESVWLIPVAWGYSLVRETMPRDERERVEKDLLAAAAEVIRAHRMGIHNIQCWKNSAVGLAGFASGNQELVKEAIDDPDRGFRVQIEKGVTADGLWFEGSLGYHQYTMSALWPLAEAARRAGIDLYSDRYRTLYDAPIALSLPNGDPPGFNDSAGGNLRAYDALYELAFARWGRGEHGRVLGYTDRDSLEALLFGAADPPKGPLAPAASILLKEAGYGALRTPQVTAVMRFGMHGGGHGHPDKLNIVTFGAGKLGGLDPGSINYGVPLHGEWYRSTIAHNTVSVDRRVQRNVDGKLEEWRVNDGVTRLAASAAGAYPGVLLRRELTLEGSTLRDVFECASEEEHVYDWAFHVPGRLSSGLMLDRVDGPLGEQNGYQHITSVYHGKTDDDWWAAWELGGTRLTLRMKGALGTEVFVGEGPGRNPEDRTPLIVVRRKARRTAFEAVHQFAPVR
ncbi:MAG: heparinase II/III family protein [Bryobacteraceae bacterium]|nr:heparinase II/III family protein [Bryobacteraceae bacterium]